MIELLFLDFFLGLLLLAGVALFYELTSVFYVMMHIHLVVIATIVSIFVNFYALISELLINPMLIIGYAIPLVVQILFSAGCVMIRARLNEAMSLLDVVIICATPALVMFLPFAIPGLQKLMPSAAKYHIYETFNVLGLVANTFILFLGGRIGWFVYRNII